MRVLRLGRVDAAASRDHASFQTETQLRICEGHSQTAPDRSQWLLSGGNAIPRVQERHLPHFDKFRVNAHIGLKH